VNKIATFLNARISGLVTDKPEILAAYSRDSSILEIMPKILAIPASTEDVQYLVRFVNELAKKGYQLPITVRGSGLDTSGADLSDQLVLSTERLNQIQEIDDRERLVRVQAGVTLGQLNSALSLFGLTLPIEADPKETIGGLVSNFYTDKIAKKYGSIYYYVERIEAVLADGELFQSQALTSRGLKQAQKRADLQGQIYSRIHQITQQKSAQIEDLRNNAHHHSGFRMITEVSSQKSLFDLTPLFFGAQGSLGVITELILRVVAIPRPTKKALFTFSQTKPAIQFMSELEKLRPKRIDFYDTRVFQALTLPKKESTFLDQIRGQFLVFTEIDHGFFTNKTSRKTLQQLAKHATATLFDQPDNLAQFSQLAKKLDFYRNDPDYPERVIIADQSYLPKTELVSFLNSLTTLEQIFGQPLPLFGSFTTNLYSVRPTFDLSTVADRKQLLRFMQQYGKLIHDSSGTIAAGSAEGRVQAIVFNQTLPTQIRALFYEIKTTFDPNHIFNPKIKQNASLADLARFMRTSPQIGLIRQD